MKTPIEDFSPEQEIEATILSIDPTTKLIHYSLQNHFLSLTSCPSITEHSSIVGACQSCVIVRAIGSSLAIRIPSLKQFGIVSSTNLTDEPVEDLHQLLTSFQPGDKHQ